MTNEELLNKINKLESENDEIKASLKIISEGKLENILTGIFDWISREHTLIDARLGWLIITNTMIFAILGVIAQLEKGFDNIDHQYLIPITIAGFVISMSFMISILLGLKTINVLRAREKYIYSNRKNESFVFRLIDPEEKFDRNSIENDLFQMKDVDDWAIRHNYTHRIAMSLHVLISVALTGFWSFFSICKFPVFLKCIPLWGWIFFILAALGIIIYVCIFKKN